MNGELRLGYYNNSLYLRVSKQVGFLGICANIAFLPNKKSFQLSSFRGMILFCYKKWGQCENIFQETFK